MASNVQSEDYYRVLGVPRTASNEEIKRAYKKGAMRHHPDKNQGNPQAEENFKKIAEAFDVLSDPQKRAAYDRYGKDGAANVEQRRTGGFSGGVDPDEIFRQFFAGQRPGGATFYFNGVPVNLNGAGFGGFPQQTGGGPDGAGVQLPPALQQLIAAVPPPLRLVGLFAAAAVFLQLFSTVASLAISRMQYLIPILWFAPAKHKPMLLLAVLAAAMLGLI